jgi:hypothetical protein
LPPCPMCHRCDLPPDSLVPSPASADDNFNREPPTRSARSSPNVLRAVLAPDGARHCAAPVQHGRASTRGSSRERRRACAAPFASPPTRAALPLRAPRRRGQHSPSVCHQFAAGVAADVASGVISGSTPRELPVTPPLARAPRAPAVPSAATDMFGWPADVASAVTSASAARDLPVTPPLARAPRAPAVPSAATDMFGWPADVASGATSGSTPRELSVTPPLERVPRAP